MISIKNNLQSDDGALLEINQSLIPANILSYSDYPTERNMMKLEENIKCEETCGGEDKSPDNGSELSDNASLWTYLSYNQRTRIRSRREDIQSKGDGGTYMNNNANENACTTTYGCNETNTLNTNWKSNGLITEESSNTHVPINSDHNVPLNVNDEDNKIREGIVTGMLNNNDNEKIDSSLMQSPRKRAQGVKKNVNSQLLRNASFGNISSGEGNEIVSCVSDIVTVIADGLLASITENKHASTSVYAFKKTEKNFITDMACPDVVDIQSIYSATGSINPKSSMPFTAAEQPHHPYTLPLPQNLRDSMKMP